jgi:hypothetical protein
MPARQGFQNSTLSPVSMINIHIGVPGVLNGVLEEFWAASQLDSAHSALPVLLDRFVQDVRPYLIGRKRDKDVVSDLRSRAIECVNKWPKDVPIAISDSLLLGGASDLFRAGPCFPNAERIVSRVCDLFNGWDLRLHLAITNQFDSIWFQPHVPIDQRVRAVRFCEFSWANLVWRLRRGCPLGRIVVWDAERPEALGPDLLRELGVRRAFVETGKSGALLAADRVDRLVLLQHFVCDDYARIDLLDQRYDEDLLKIGSFSRVKLYSGSDHSSVLP